MAPGKGNMRALIEQRDRLMGELEALRNKVEGLNLAISILQQDGDHAIDLQSVSRRSGVKAYVINLLKEVGASGLNATAAVDMALKRGHALDRGTVSSLLSRLKQDGAVTYDGSVYRLATSRFARSNGPEISQSDPAPAH